MEIQLWREILDPYSLAVDELVTKFNHIIDEYKHVGAYSPIEQVTGRVKTISSILEKSQKKSIELENFEENIDDIAGIRIICQFVEDIYKVVDIVKKRSDMRIKNEKDYINNMKKSGYRSYHLIVYYDVETLKGKKELQVEIQIRTLAMNFWATIEHSLQYKYKQNMPEHIRERLSSAAEAILILDREMSVVRDEIMDAQNSFTIKANIVADILTNIQNLYKVAKKQEVVSIQDEFFRIYQNGDQDELAQFSRDLDMISARYRAQSLR
ncbi:MAG: yjbM [Herbinix sp.]|jgi:putative GTP pyrophosphokinase|nr:yjbM [Herbinix sp.]